MYQSIKAAKRFFTQIFAINRGGVLPPARKNVIPPRKVILQLEELENRLLLSAWAPIGPAPLLDPNSVSSVPKQAASGRISALAITSDFSSGTEKDFLYLGAAGGGAWVSSDFTGAMPTWQSLSDSLVPIDPLTGAGAGVIDVGTIAVIPGVGTVGASAADQRGKVFVGTGEANLNSTDVRYGSGIQSAATGAALGAPVEGGLGAAGLPVFFRHSISKIIVDPLDHQKLWAAVIRDDTGATTGGTGGRPNLLQDDGIYSSVNGGHDWSRVAAAFASIGTDAAGAIVTDLEYTVDTSSPAKLTLWAGVRDNGIGKGGFWRSADEGATWTQLDGLMGHPGIGAPASANIGRVALAADHTAGSNTIYAAVANYDDTFRGVFRSTDGGAIWSDLHATLTGQDQMVYDLAFGLNPANRRVYLGGQTQVIEYDPTAAAWNTIRSSPMPAGSNGPHEDDHALAFASDGTVYLGTDGGLWRYHPAAAAGKLGTWDDLNTPGLQTLQLYNVAVSPADPNTMLSASQDNGVSRTVEANVGATATWNSVRGGDGFAVRFDSRDSKGQRALTLVNDDGIELSTDGGRTWRTRKLAQDGSEKVTYEALALDPNGPGVLLGRQGMVWQASIQSLVALTPIQSWKRLSPQLDSSAITTLSFADNGGHESGVYAAHKSGKLFWSATPIAVAGSWKDVTGSWGNRRVTGIAAPTQNPGTAFVSIGDFIDGLDAGGHPVDVNAVGQVWITTNFGTEWFDIAGDRTQVGALPNVPVNSIVYDQQHNTLYVGTDIGVFRGQQAGASNKVWTWDRFGDSSLPQVQVTDLQLVNTPDGKELVAATHGRGVWTVSLNPPGARTQAVEGQPDTGIALGSFADPSGSGPSRVAIAWGDGTTSAGDVIRGSGQTATIEWDDDSAAAGTLTLAPDNSTWTLAVDHTWAEEGSYTISTTVTMVDGSAVGLNPVTADVGDAALTATATTIQATSGVQLSGAVAANFTDANPNAPLSDFSAQIDWGDGNAAAGTVVANSDGTFSVQGNHTYTDAGSFTVQVSINDVDGAFADVTENVVVSGPITETASAPSAVEGIDTGSVTVASFTAATPGTFLASIDWGDGTVTDGTVTASGGHYFVLGDHTYAEEGYYGLTVSLSGGPGVAASASDVVYVADAALTASAHSFSTTVGTPLNGAAVATFSDGDPNGQAGDFTAAIDWGDGAVSDGTVQAAAGGGFSVLGGHTYEHAGVYSLNVSFLDAGGSIADATANVAVALNPTTTTVASSANPSSYNQSVTFTATVAASSGGGPTGSVNFMADQTPLGAVAVDAFGNASFSTSALSVGGHAITAAYSGDANYAASSGGLGQTVNSSQGTATTTTLTSSTNPSTVGQSVTFTAVVAGAGGTPTGTVTFEDAGSVLGRVALDSTGTAAFTTSGLSVGSHPITAVYGDDANFAGSSGGWTQTVNQSQGQGTATTTSLTSSTNPSMAGQAVTFTAILYATGTPTGTISFYDGAALLAAVAVSNGAAAFTTSALSVGSHPITAVYGGDANFQGSTSGVVSQQVNTNQTGTVLSSSAPSAPYGQPVTFTAGVEHGGGTPTGTISFYDGSILLATVAVNNGTASFTIATLSRGSHSITAVYSGDANDLGSTSSPFDITIM